MPELRRPSARECRLAAMAYTNGASAGPIHAGERFTEAETKRITEALSRDGHCFLGTSILEQDEVAALRDAMERMVDDPAMQEDQPGNHRKARSLMRMFEYDRSFRDLIVREPFASLAEAVLGDQCHVMGQNALFTEPNPDATADGPGGWHLDDLVQFPLPPEIARHDPGVPLPCNVMQLFTPLTSIDSVACGPTQVVPQSHYAGRRPDGPGPPRTSTATGRCRSWRSRATPTSSTTRSGTAARPTPRTAAGCSAEPPTASASSRSVSTRSSTTTCPSTCGREQAHGCSGCSAATSTGPTAEFPTAS